jgi:hypothetical protein
VIAAVFKGVDNPKAFGVISCATSSTRLPEVEIRHLTPALSAFEAEREQFQ